MPKIKDIKTSEFYPSGILDMDSDLRKVPTSKGNYIMAQDIQHLPGGTNQEEFVINAPGNKFVFSLPTIVEQDKTYQITIAVPASGSVTYSIGMLNINGSSSGISGFASQTVLSTSSLPTVVSSFISSIQSLLTLFNPTVVAGSSPGTIDITLSPPSIAGFDYLIIDNPVSGTTSSNPVVIAEAIAQNLAGSCYPVGGYDYLNDLFILSSTQDNKPSQYDIINISVVSGSVQVTIGSSASINDGDEINISGVSGLSNNLNGNWIALNVTHSGSNTIFTLYSAQSFTGTLSGTPILTLNPSGFLDISVFQYNVTTNAWSGTQLLDTKAINNRIYNPLTMLEIDKSNNIIALYFSDNNDTPRCWEYTGPYVTNGSIEPIVSTGYYFYEGINQATNLFNENATCTIDLISVSNAGGEVASGIWKYAGCFLDSSKNASYPSLLSNPVTIFSADESDPVTVMGDTAGVATTKQVVLQIKNIPADTYPFFQLLGVNNVGGVETAYIIKTVSIPEGATSIRVTHTGFESYVEYDAGLLDQQGEVYATVKTGAIVKDTFIIGNITQPAIKDLTSWAQTFMHTVSKNTTGLSPIGDDIFGYKIGDYMDPQAVFSLTGYTDNETIRLGAELELNNGSRTPAFWIDDIRLDNFIQATLSITIISGTFSQGDTIVQATTNATGIVESYSSGTLVVGVTSGTFTLGHNITDTTSSATASVSSVINIPFNRAGIKGNRRLGSFSSYDLSSNNNTAPQTNNAYVTYVNFSGIDFTALINGQPIYSFAKRLHIVRIDNIENDLQEVLSCGIGVRQVIGVINSGGPTPEVVPSVATNVATTIYDNPFLFTALTLPIYNIINPTAIPVSTLFSSTGASFSYAAWRQSISATPVLNGLSFYSPDLYFNQSFIDYRSDDEIINYGQPDFRVVVSGSPLANVSAYDTYGGGTFSPGTIANAQLWSTFIKMCGSTGQSNVENNYIGILGSNNVESFAGQVGYPDSTDYYTTRYSMINSLGNYTWDTANHLIMQLSNNLIQVNSNMGTTTPSATNLDIGIYYTQYYRDKGSKAAYITGQSKFGSITTGTYTTTGCYIDITDIDSASLDVYGGDTFTQQVFYKLRYPRGSSTDPAGYNTGAGVCVAFYCQNHFNWNMRNHIYPADTMGYPNYPLGSWLNNSYSNPDNTNYDIGYTPQNKENNISAFNPNTQVSTYMYEREAYSGAKAQDSLTNGYRQFLPLDITDLSPNEGPITRLMNIQGELFSWQPKGFYRQFFNETGTLNVSDAASESEVILGSGASFTKPPQLLSSNGCSNLFSILRGKGLSGEDVVAWVDITNTTIMMFSPGSGVVDIGLQGRLRSFLSSAMKWITADNPTIRNGINGVFNSIRKEFIWTFFGYYNNPNDSWFFNINYNKGAAVIYNTTFEGIPQWWIANVANINSAPSPTNPNWTAVPYTNTKYYSCFTLIYSLIKGGFTTFMTPKPYMYFQWEGTYLSPYPVLNNNQIFQADLGVPTTWYTVRTSQTSEAFITWVVNDYATVGKRFVAQWYSSLLTPFLINYITNVPSNLWNPGAIGNQASFLNNTNFINKLNYYQANIQSDSTPSGSNTGMTGNLWGDYLVSTLFFQTGVSQQFESCFTKYLPLHRMPIE